MSLSAFWTATATAAGAVAGSVSAGGHLTALIMRTVIIYLAALFIVRLMGKRALGTLSLFDFVIMVGIGDIIVMVGVEGSVSLLSGISVLIVLGVLELLFSLLTFKSKAAARILEGMPTVLVQNGKLMQENMAREHVSLADLKQELRKEGVSQISSVKEALLEACGKFSVILKDDVEPMSREESMDQFEEMAELKEDIVEVKKLLQQLLERERY
ncbi:MAG TPA: DUF421 domain-containing protein [Firmicutes bacterium]|jgi:uncharacterized membrane protein YcaP (DUF421 family)|nr:DUF421 domain-containing protein [Bacillota bacterium]HAZ21149.1 DUF421 domain-containing protein [Bacillota bacterium]HBE07077.1 DUF421 domain-containing protein [Bacillota bacterium]HBL49822.1 DUF421 domain-containing protein [Bacillota bacterium]HCF89740.1 DUF421 domain-containing protein [Bacillota bacterium]